MSNKKVRNVQSGKKELKGSKMLAIARKDSKKEQSSRKTKELSTKDSKKVQDDYGTTYTGKKNALEMIISGGIEAPECNYNIPAATLVKILQEYGFAEKEKDGGYNKFSRLFTALREHEDYSVLNSPPVKPRKKKGVKDEDSTDVDEIHQTAPPFEEKVVNALFWIPKNKHSGQYKYLRVRLAPSNIKAAGIGAYAVDTIPKGARGVYKGLPLDEEDTNMYYSWTVKSFDPETGQPDDADEPTYYIDATKLETSNWTRYVNCGMKNKINNFDSDQLYDKFFYVSKRDIEPDEELWIDYGDEYREDNLGMKGKY